VKLRRRYLIAGIAWALLIGPAAAFLLFGFAAGASWLWLFGDDPWPEATQWALPLIGITGGALAALTCMIVAYSYGRAQEARTQANARTERRKVLVLAFTPLVLLFLFGLKIWRESREYAQDMELAAQREAAFAALSGDRHRIADVTLDQSADDHFRATIRITGERAGEYRLHWQVADTGFGAVLAAGNEVIRLQPGEVETEIVVTLDELARSYRTKVLHGNGGVLVEEPFRLEVSLVPIFSDAERGALPPGERRRLDAGESPLRSVKSTEFPVRFIIGPDVSTGR
jgi:hypothetical protein